MGHAVRKMYHPSHRVPDLAEAERFFEVVFGRKSFQLGEYLGYGGRVLDPRYPTDYSFFTPIADVLFDCIDPRRYVFDGIQRYESVEAPQLYGFGWFVDGIEDLWTELRRHGIRGTDQRNVLPDGDGPPLGYLSESPLIFTVAEDSGLRYEFATAFDHPMDPRSAPGWSIPEHAPDDPLGIEHCAYHTVISSTRRPLTMLVDILGGTVIHRARNVRLGADSEFVALADAVFEVACPVDSSAPSAYVLKRMEPDDLYHSLTWKVADLGAVERHLTACGVRFSHDGPEMVVAEAEDGLGIPWGFTTALVPGDARRGGRG